MKIIDYGVCMEDGLRELIESTNKSIQEGWQPLGGITRNETQQYWVQALVKYEQTSDDIDYDYREKIRNCPHREWEMNPTDVSLDQCKNCGVLFRDTQDEPTKQYYFPFDKCPHEFTETIGETKSLIRCKQCGTVRANPNIQTDLNAIDKTRNNE